MLKRVAFHVHLAAHLQAAPIFLLSNLKTSLAKKHAPPELKRQKQQTQKYLQIKKNRKEG